MEPNPATDVDERPTCVGIALVSRRGCYLVRPRPAGTALAGLWEFPGGKCMAGESPAAATARECYEELGIDVVVGPLRRRTTHRYPHGVVTLSFFDCTTATADAEPDPSTGFRWVPARELVGLPFPEANGPILDELAHAGPADRPDLT